MIVSVVGAVGEPMVMVLLLPAVRRIGMVRERLPAGSVRLVVWEELVIEIGELSLLDSEKLIVSV